MDKDKILMQSFLTMIVVIVVSILMFNGLFSELLFMNDSFESCEELSSNCSDVTIEATQETLTVEKHTIFDVEEFDEENIIFLTKTPADWPKKYVVIKFTTYTEDGTIISQNKVSVLASSENSSQTYSYKIDEEDAKLISHIDIEIIGGTNFRYDY